MRIPGLLLCGCMTTAMAASGGISQADTAAKQLPFLGPPPPQELQVLAPLVAQWTSKTEVRPSLNNKERVTGAGHFTGQWLHNRHFIRLEGVSAGTQFQERFTVLLSFDTKKKLYRRWVFSSSGLVTESEGQWDEASHTMTWKILSLAPNTTGFVKDVVQKDRFESTVHVRRADGQILVDLTVSATRKR